MQTIPPSKGVTFLPCYDKYLSGLGLRATGGCKPRQVRKEATVAVRFVCRGSPGAWHCQEPAPCTRSSPENTGPKTFQDVVNQEHVKTTLENAIAQNRIAHGYIFSGQRGTGKTTVARILARCLNCMQGPTATPCGECASCLEITAGGTVDVIEIDAASNRGINEMRELRENVRYQPARDRYKVFIVDEAHQITSEAFNALLKTIEEPPPVGGLRALHHRGAQNSRHHRLALPALQLSLGGFRRPDRAHGVDLRAGRH